MNLVEDVKPQLDSIDRTTAVFTSSTILYNDSSVTYSSSTTLYGGSDRNADRSPQLLTINNVIPTLDSIS